SANDCVAIKRLEALLIARFSVSNVFEISSQQLACPDAPLVQCRDHTAQADLENLHLFPGNNLHTSTRRRWRARYKNCQGSITMLLHHKNKALLFSRNRQERRPYHPFLLEAS